MTSAAISSPLLVSTGRGSDSSRQLALRYLPWGASISESHTYASSARRSASSATRASAYLRNA